LSQNQPDAPQSLAADARAAGLHVTSRLATSFIGLAIIFVLTRLLEKADFGRFALLFGFFEVLEMLLALGIPASVLFLIPLEGRDKARTIGFGSTVLLTGVGFAAGALLVLMAPWIGGWVDGVPGGVFSGLVRWLGVYVALALPGGLISPYLLATERPGWALIYTITHQVLRLGCVVVPAFLGYPIETVVACFVASGLVPMCSAWILVVAVDRSGPMSVVGSYLKKQLSYGMPFAVSLGVGKINRWLDKYMVGILMPMNAVAVYSACSRELPVVSDVPHGSTTALIPTLTLCHAANDKNRFVEIWQELMSKTALLMFPLFSVCFALAPEIVAVLFTEAYLDGTGIFRLYLLLMPLRLCIYGGILRALGDTKMFMKIMIGVTFLNVIGNVVLFQLIGWGGPALSSVLTHALTVILLLRYAARLLERSAWSVFPWARLCRVAVVSGLSVIPVVFLSFMEVSALARLGVGLSTYLFVYLLLGLVSGVLKRSDLTYLYSLFRKTA
jgi:O-antigen/teichoic acid export membrane protein